MFTTKKTEKLLTKTQICVFLMYVQLSFNIKRKVKNFNLFRREVSAYTLLFYKNNEAQMPKKIRTIKEQGEAQNVYLHHSIFHFNFNKRYKYCI